jgi:hypothetical protein
MSRLRQFVRTAPLARPLRLARLRRIARTYGHEDWRKLLGANLVAWEEARKAAVGGPRVLIATSTGGHFSVTAIDRLLAVALTLRGAETSIGLCDGMLSACQMCEANLLPDFDRFARRGPAPDLCGYCYGPAAHASSTLGLSVVPYGGELTEADHFAADGLAAGTPLESIERLDWNGIPVGEHAMAGALRFFARGELDSEPAGEAVLRRYLKAALQTAMSVDRLMSRLRPQVVVAHHGIYVPQGVVTAVAHHHGARVVTWNPAYRKHCFVFSHDDTYHRTMMEEPLSSWADRPLAPDEATLIDDYLRSRWHGGKDWIRFHRDPDYELTDDLFRLGLDPDKPTVVALTNVFWDAQLHYPKNAFASQRDWLVRTIRWFADRADLQLVIRIHPAEITGSPASRQFAADEIAAAFPRLPPNVRVVPPTSAVSTYHLAQRCDCAIIYATKTGVELAAIGIPVIAAGEAWVRNKGITRDATSEQSYLKLLEQLPLRKRLAPETVERARRYAFHFFFRRMIPLEFVEPAAGARRFSTRIGGLADLKRQASVGLDVICDGILSGTPFHMPEAAAVAIARRTDG